MTQLRRISTVNSSPELVRKRVNDLTDLVNALGSNQALPAGGTTNQVLRKASGNDFDVEWGTVSGGGGGSTAWGDITGTLSSQTDLQAALDAKAASSHTHTASQITDLSNNLRVFIQTTQPSVSGPYLWIDTTGGNLQFKVEDGL